MFSPRPIGYDYCERHDFNAEGRAHIGSFLRPLRALEAFRGKSGCLRIVR